jgi:hypothetical protein
MTMTMPPLNRFKRFDVRGLLRRGVEPLPEICKRLDALDPDAGLIVVAPFLPSPLVERLTGEGFASTRCGVASSSPACRWLTLRISPMSPS